MDVQLVELWFSSYIGDYLFHLMHTVILVSSYLEDLLKRKQLWKEAALIVKLCPLEEISSESQVRTVLLSSPLYVSYSPPPPNITELHNNDQQLRIL